MEVAVPGSYRIEGDVYRGEAAEYWSEDAVAPELDAQELEDEKGRLRKGTKRRNREFHEALDEMHKSFDEWEQKLEKETAEREKTNTELASAMAQLLKDAVEVEAEAMKFFQGVHGTDLPLREAALTQVEKKVTIFASETVPQVTAKSDDIAKKLQKDHETFDIENARILKREHQKIIARFHVFTQRTAQSFEDERATRQAMTLLFLDDLRHIERSADAHDELHTSAAHNSIVALKHHLQTDVVLLREAQDNVLLDAMIFAQHMLQASVLKAFGSSSSSSFS